MCNETHRFGDEKAVTCQKESLSFESAEQWKGNTHKIFHDHLGSGISFLQFLLAFFLRALLLFRSETVSETIENKE